MINEQHRPRAEFTTTGEREMRIERVYPAPRERVFAIYTDPALIPRWWGPRSTTATVEEMDVRPGGRWRFLVRNSDGRETAFRGVYREVLPPERVEQTFEWEGAPGHVSVETATFEDLGQETRVVIVAVFHTAADLQSMLESGMEGGASETYERLEDLLLESSA